MASYHLSVKTVKRSAGRSATAAAAYRSASIIACEREGREHDYTAKRGVEACFILAPDDAPDWAQDRAALWNAAEARTVKTLSGGETFLASMALSVALAERIHDLCTTTSGDRMLESLFLDEGFGTLDPESLDVVIGALEELRTSGRMVGVISHVGTMQERIRTGVRVIPSEDGSTVQVGRIG